MYEIGNTYTAELYVDSELVEKFAEFSGDRNPIHVDRFAAQSYGHPRPVAHGAILVAMLSRLIGMEIPGKGAVWLSQDIKWVQPVYVGDTVKVIAEITSYSKGAGLLQLSITAYNQKNIMVMSGESSVKIGTQLSNHERKAMSEKGVALVTGGSRGIGASVSVALAQQGFDIALVYAKSKNEAEGVASQIRDAERQCHLIQTDLNETVDPIVEAMSSFGPISALIHCASPRIESMPAQDMSAQEMMLHWSVACKAGAELVSLLAPGMIEREFGRIVFMGTSAMTNTPQSGWASYLMAKHALWAYVRNLAVELGPKGITSNMVSPSLVVTDLTADIPHRVKEVEAQRNPMRRLATPDDVSQTIAFLCQENSSFINGQNIFITGGA